MKIDRLDRRGLRRLADAVREGEPVELELSGAPRGVRLDEIAPLCAEIRCVDRRLGESLRGFRAPGPRPGHPARVTAVIPCSRGLPLGVRKLLAQDVSVSVLVLSNGDGPRAVPGADVVVVPWRGHGATRQLAVAMVEDPYVLFTVDDAIPLGAGCVRTLVEALEDGGWDAVIGRQVPWPDADAVTAERLRRWTPPGHRVVAAPQSDHVFTLVRTETLRRHPLPDVPIAEDAWWSRGRSIGYVPGAPVLHSHRRAPLPLYRRNLAMHAELAAMGREPTVPTARALLAALPGVARSVAMAGPIELVNEVAELLGQWRGALAGRKRRS